MSTELPGPGLPSMNSLDPNKSAEKPHLPGFERKDGTDKKIDNPSVLDDSVDQATRQRVEHIQEEINKRQEQKDKVDQALEPEQGPPKTLGEKYDRDIAEQMKILRSTEKGPNGKLKYGGLEKIMASVAVVMLFMDKMKNYSKLGDAINAQGENKEGEQKSPEKVREEQILKQLQDGKDRDGRDLPPPGGQLGLQVRLAEQMDPTIDGSPSKELENSRNALKNIRAQEAGTKTNLENLKTQLSTADEAARPGLQQQVAQVESALKVLQAQIQEAEKNSQSIEKRVQEAKADMDLLKKMVADRKKEAETFGKQHADLMTGLDTSGTELTDPQKKTVDLLKTALTQQYTVDDKLQGVVANGQELKADDAKTIMEEFKAAKIVQSTDGYSAIGLEAPQAGTTEVKIADFQKFAETAQKYVKELMKTEKQS